MSSCSISLVVKNALLREGLRRILSENNFNIEQSLAEIVDIRLEVDNESHVIIMEHSVDRKSSSEETVDTIGRFRRSRAVVLADRFDLGLAMKFFAAGACGYILNNVPYRTFLTMMQLVAMGESVVPSQFISSISGCDFQDRDFPNGNRSYETFGLTERDVRILKRLSLGMSNKLISREMGISEATVKIAVKNLFRKLSVSNRTQAAIIGRDMNIV